MEKLFKEKKIQYIIISGRLICDKNDIIKSAFVIYFKVTNIDIWKAVQSYRYII